MKFSQSIDLAIHALIAMAEHTTDKPIMIRKLAKAVHASESYLARIMLNLVKAGLIKSIRGKHGGFVFKQAPEVITIADVVIAIDHEVADFSCCWEIRNCDQSEECTLRNLFREAQEQMLAVLRTMTIREIANSPNCKTLLCDNESQD
jgi:Rrf2 family protein